MTISVNSLLHVIVICTLCLLCLSLVMYLVYAKHLDDDAMFRQSNRRYYALQLVMNLAEDGWALQTRTPDGWRIEKASEMFCQILGYDWKTDIDNEVVGKSKSELASPDSGEKIQLAYTQEYTVARYLMQIYRKDGKAIWCETSAQTMTFLDTGEKRVTVIKNVEHVIARFKSVDS